MKMQPTTPTTLQWQTSNPLWNDPRTAQAEASIKRILHLTEMADKLPDAFNDAANVTHSLIPAANTPARISITAPSATNIAPKAKHGRP
jgi:hypothetical protein